LSPLLTSVIGVILDRIYGEPNRWHPLVGFGQLAGQLEARLNKEHCDSGELKVRGVISVVLLILPFILIAYWISSFGLIGVLFDIVLVYLAIGSRSLQQHAMRVYDALSSHDINQARSHIAMLVSRDTSALTEKEIAKATVESVLENGCDAVFGALFWFVVAGAPGIILYRLANTLDAMWGYKTSRFHSFGWAAARLDDVLNYVPARLTALTYSLLGKYKNAISCWKSQGNLWKSPNAGPVMAAGAGALDLQIGGEASYHGELQQRPVLGRGSEPVADDIARATRLVRRGIYLWLAIFVILWSLV